MGSRSIGSISPNFRREHRLRCGGGISEGDYIQEYDQYECSVEQQYVFCMEK